MTMKKDTRDQIIKKLIHEIGEKESAFSALQFAKQFGLNIQSVYRYLRNLEEQGKIDKLKEGHKNKYRLIEQELTLQFLISETTEDIIWRKHAAPFLADVPEIANNNLAYAFTEMVNNAIEHSNGTQIDILLQKNGYRVSVWIEDDGIGIFRKIADAMGLEEKSFAVLELAKGKFTTEPNSHTGEGVFFSSKVMDEFAILSDKLVFIGGKTGRNPYLDNFPSETKGTTIYMSILYDHTETSREVFDKYSEDPDSYGFTKTRVPVRLLEYGDEKPLVISRSQARRLMVRFERFENIILDFQGIDEIGQGFADELFRVFRKEHPKTRLTPVNCSEQVIQMIKRVVNQK